MSKDLQLLKSARDWRKRWRQSCSLHLRIPRSPSCSNWAARKNSYKPTLLLLPCAPSSQQNQDPNMDPNIYSMLKSCSKSLLSTALTPMALTVFANPLGTICWSQALHKNTFYTQDKLEILENTILVLCCVPKIVSSAWKRILKSQTMPQKLLWC